MIKWLISLVALVSALVTIEDACDWEDFELGDVLGKGGHGIVVRAVHKPSAQQVALKIMSRRKEDESELGREEHIHKSMDHPMISRFYCRTKVVDRVSINGKSFERGDPVFVLELVNGRSLRDLMKRSESLPIPPKRLTRNIIQVLKYLKKKHVVFGDLSSGNLMITREGSIKLVDFGAALRIQKDRAQDPIPAFVSYKTRPHRWKNYAADWYSLGLLLRELLVFEWTGIWRDQRTMRGMDCMTLLGDRTACDFIGLLVPPANKWNEICGMDEKSLRKIESHSWLK